MTSLRGAVIRFLLGKFNVWNKPLDDIRKTMEKIKAQGMPLGVESEIDELNGIPVYRLFPPGAPKKKAILYFHGADSVSAYIMQTANLRPALPGKPA